MSTNFEDRKIQILEAPTRQGMYNDNKFDQQTNAIWEDFEAGHLTYQEVCFWFYLNKLAGHNRETYPTQKYIADKFKVTPKTVGRWADALEAKGWVVKLNRTGTSNKYWIAIPQEFNAINDMKYSARLSTVGQELATGKRSTKAKKDTLRDMNVSMDLDSSNSEVRDMDVSMKGHGCLFDKDMDVSLNRESYNQRKLQPEKTQNNQGVTTVTREGENEVLPLAKTNTAFGGKVTSGREIMEIGFFPLASEAIGSADISSDLPSGSPLVDVVEADASPTSSGLEDINPGYSSVTKKNYTWEVPKRDVHVYNETVTVDQEVTEASVSVVDAKEAEEVITIPKPPQKPVPSVPGRSQYDTDMSYQKKKDNAESAHLKAMGKWRQDLTIWENKYGDNPSVEEPTAPTPLSAEAQAKLDRYAKLQKHAY